MREMPLQNLDSLLDIDPEYDSPCLSPFLEELVVAAHLGLILVHGRGGFVIIIVKIENQTYIHVVVCYPSRMPTRK